MRRVWLYGIGISFSLGAALGAGCAAGGDPGTPGSGGAGNNGGTGGVVTTNSGGGGDTTIDSGTPDGFGECTNFKAEAKQAPAAMLIVLDRSASMNGSKWSTAQLAVVQAIDKDAFDTMSMGLMSFPDKEVPAPACISFLTPTVACGFPGLPQVAISAAGADKSNAPQGVRHAIYQWLVQNSPSTDPFDASPVYDSLAAAYNALKGINIDKRIAVLITDGGFACTSLSNPTRPGYFDGACNDWEYPDTVNKLINDNRLNPATPINTFIVGVPGSNSAGEMQGNYATAPYHMSLALSTYAVSGSPDTVDPNCDKGLVFTKNGLDPLHPCHIDLSNGNNFNPDALANAISAIRGKALGCLYDLPPPPPGEQIDKSLVNVVVTINGMDYVIPKRKDAADMCLQDPCWDYNADGKVELIGITCTELSKAADAKVEIYVGCSTILK